MSQHPTIKNTGIYPPHPTSSNKYERYLCMKKIGMDKLKNIFYQCFNIFQLMSLRTPASP